MRTARATVHVLPLPDLAPGCKRFEVDCPASVTGLTHVPHATLRLSDEMLILAAGYAHEEKCGECSVEDVLAQGDQQLRATTEEAWSRFRAAAIRQRRNRRRSSSARPPGPSRSSRTIWRGWPRRPRLRRARPTRSTTSQGASEEIGGLAAGVAVALRVALEGDGR